MMLAVRLCALLTLLIVAAPGQAVAAKVTVARGSDNVSFVATRGERNNVAIAYDQAGRHAVIRDSGALLLASGGCESLGAHAVRCAPRRSSTMWFTEVELADGDDRLSVGPGPAHVSVNGGAGDDVLRGGEQWDLLHGGPGHDRLHGGLHDDSLYGGAGDDRLVGDEARAVQRPQVDEQGVVTGAGADALSGGDGADRLIGRAASDSLSGGPGDDRLAAGAGGDVLQGGAGSDSLSCGSGADQVRPPAAEELFTSACEFIRFDWQTLETLMSLGFSPYPRATSAGSATFALGCPAHDEDGVSVHYPSRERSCCARPARAGSWARGDSRGAARIRPRGSTSMSDSPCSGVAGRSGRQACSPRPCCPAGTTGGSARADFPAWRGRSDSEPANNGRECQERSPVRAFGMVGRDGVLVQICVPAAARPCHIDL